MSFPFLFSPFNSKLHNDISPSQFTYISSFSSSNRYFSSKIVSYKCNICKGDHPKDEFKLLVPTAFDKFKRSYANINIVNKNFLNQMRDHYEIEVVSNCRFIYIFTHSPYSVYNKEKLNNFFYNYLDSNGNHLAQFITCYRFESNKTILSYFTESNRSCKYVCINRLKQVIQQSENEFININLFKDE